ncbi:MAG: hydroxysqualene dehydroxylase HpnE [Acidobacteriales bacterium]|nr:hydroxysqualene dehydroxylase HpnE [Terriglobales bacterium]
MSDVIIAGGGLAGLAAAVRLADAGFQVHLFEERGFLGGRATSYPYPHSETEVIDNCQHILLGCCEQLLDFYERLGVAGKVRFHDRYYFLEPGGRLSTLKSGLLPAPLHFAGSFASLKFLTAGEKFALACALARMRRDRRTRDELDQITMREWLDSQRQPGRLIERFWKPVLVSAVNEDLDRMAASHGFQVLKTGMLGGPRDSAMGVPSVPLGELYGAGAWRRYSNVTIHLQTSVSEVLLDENEVRGVRIGDRVERADYYVSALPVDRASALLAPLRIPAAEFGQSPITGIHLWFDRPVTDLPHAVLLDGTLHWMFNKREGRYLLVVVSASRGLVDKSRAEVIETALRELGAYLPAVREARLEKAHVVKETKATFSARPGLDALRPGTQTRYRNLFLAGDWTRTGWPATMEGAVRSGYSAAEAISHAASL